MLGKIASDSSHLFEGQSFWRGAGCLGSTGVLLISLDNWRRGWVVVVLPLLGFQFCPSGQADLGELCGPDALAVTRFVLLIESRLDLRLEVFECQLLILGHVANLTGGRHTRGHVLSSEAPGRDR